MTIKIVVTRERFEEVVSIDDEMHFSELTRKEVYDYMVKFCKNGNDTYLSDIEARKLFKTIPSKDLGTYITQFFKAVSEAFVNPRSEGTLEGQSLQEQERLQNG